MKRNYTDRITGGGDRALRHFLAMNKDRPHYKYGVRFDKGRCQRFWRSLHRTRSGVKFNALIRLVRNLHMRLPAGPR